jgi:hypothetical protein
MQFRLRTLLIVLALGPVVLAAGYWAVQKWQVEPLLILEAGSFNRGVDP